eukprot:tig00000681_g3116.t1
MEGGTTVQVIDAKGEEWSLREGTDLGTTLCRPCLGRDRIKAWAPPPGPEALERPEAPVLFRRIHLLNDSCRINQYAPVLPMVLATLLDFTDAAAPPVLQLEGTPTAGALREIVEGLLGILGDEDVVVVGDRTPWANMRARLGQPNRDGVVPIVLQ